MKKRLQTLVLAVTIATVFAAGMISSHIAPDTVRKAAELIGLDFTGQEIDSMMPQLESLRDNYSEIRAKDIPNHIAPPLYFNPVLPGMKIFQDADLSSYRRTGRVKMPKNMEELAFYSLEKLAVLVRTRQISSEELTRFFMKRLRSVDSSLHCVITMTEERALEKARMADREIAQGWYRGPLHGIPYGAKDLLAVRGYPTTWGAKPFKDQQFDMDASVIEQLDAAGAVLIAKLSLGALAWGDVWYGGMTRNPWDTLGGSSGSSAGSSAAVAAGALPFAIGSETLGSIVSPSTVCGTTGLRPSFGRVSRHGAMALSWTMDKLGPIARSAYDCALVLEAISLPDERDLYCANRPFRLNSTAIKAKKLRIGYIRDDFDKNYPFRHQDSALLALLKQKKYQLTPISLPKKPALDPILMAESAAAFDKLTTSNLDDSLVRQNRYAWPNFFRASRMIPAVEYINANRARYQLMMQMDSLFQQVDVIIHPSWASDALSITNHTGHPTVVIPNGFHEGKPTSISITGPLFGEALIVEIAENIQQLTNWHEQHPQWLMPKPPIKR